MILIKLLNIIAIALENNIEISDNAQLLLNGEILTLNTLINRFKKQGVADPEQEGNRLVEYLKNNNNIIEFYDIYQ